MENIIYCPWEPATFLFLSSNVPLLINYSHFIAIFSAVAISLLVFVSNPKAAQSRLFLFFSFFFSIWAILNVILWATNDPAVVMFAWSMQVLIEPITFAIAFYLFYIFLHGKIPLFRTNVLVSLLLLPIVFFLPSTLNLEALQLSYCESIEGPLAKYYTYFVNLIFILMILYIGKRKIPKMNRDKRKISILFGVGLVTFLLSFTSGNIISSFTDDWTISQYGLFGMPIFASMIAYSMVQFKAFKVLVNGAKVLVVVLWALVGSLLFVDSALSDILVSITLVFTTIAGFLLIRSVDKEIAQRKEIEQLVISLDKANVRLKELDKQKSEFVSIASHQLRSPLTAIRGYASLLIEGSYGKMPKKAIAALERISTSSKLMAIGIEDYLNVSRIESGNMKYNYTDFNLKDEVEHICDDLRTDALKKGLVLLFRSDLKSRGIIHADIGKTVQIVQNLINNSIKYTEHGSIKVLVRDDVVRKKIFVDIMDTGIGMNEKTLQTIFQKFERADNANSVNIHGTGLGLFVALKMAEAMKGTISAHSEGDRKGSRFTVELPLAL